MAGEIWHAEHEAAKVEGCALCYPDVDDQGTISDERKAASVQAFEDGLRVPQERCPRCLQELDPVVWEEHMTAALKGACPLVRDQADANRL